MNDRKKSPFLSRLQNYNLPIFNEEITQYKRDPSSGSFKSLDRIIKIHD